MELTALRASQINGCASCALGHVREATTAGATPEQLATVATWRETPYFTEADRAALALTETMTRLADTAGVPDEVYDDAAKHYAEKQLAALILMIATLNFFNRVNVTVREQADRPNWEGSRVPKLSKARRTLRTSERRSKWPIDDVHWKV